MEEIRRLFARYRETARQAAAERDERSAAPAEDRQRRRILARR